MKLRQLIDDYKIIIGSISSENEIESCEIHSEKAKADSLLFVLPSVRGNTYLDKERFMQSKALAIVTERGECFRDSPIPIIAVKNVREAYARARSRIEEIDYSKLKFIGVTGTNGKTTTATLIYEILRHAGKKCAFIGTGKIIYCEERLSDDRYSMTSPDPETLYPLIKNLAQRGCEAIVMEVSSHALKLSKVSPINFDLAIFTGLSEEHLDFHKDMSDYFESKRLLIDNAKRVIINCDDEYGRRLYDTYKSKAVGVSVRYRYDSYATDITYRGILQTKFEYIRKGIKTTIKTNLAGEYNIINTMLAFEAISLMNVSAAVAKEALLNIKKIEGRCEMILSDITVIIDYAHTPQALENILKIAKSQLNQGQKLHLVFGCGGERDTSKRSTMAAIAEKYADFIAITEDNSRGESLDKIIFDICSGFSLSKHTVIKRREDAIKKTIASASLGDTIIIAGKGHERYIIDENGYRSFDEREIISDALRIRGGSA